ncbi:enoyl-CoA hydratase [Gordonia sp. ABSL11-1]|uniref:enoyl-CoA hydratase n=1 Tax=Gordonia sp. ABSL11-1 TaxID=3053924 RepID=UPI002573B987|nr:enoyl-CoA hydratase [Gordonia sp. ABSL11-1]MDL9947146.1 enoyl-CoA hydratase [Gordonia sp. ABSL11-1]
MGVVISMRGICALVCALTVGALAFVDSGSAHAEPQLPRIVQYTENIGTFGDHDFCRGSLNLGTVAPKDKRGVVRLTVASFGFTGNGPGWKRDPNCRFNLNYFVISAAVPYEWVSVPVSFGPRPGQKYVREIFTGSGVVDLGVGTAPLNQGKGTPKSFGTGMYMIVP